MSLQHKVIAEFIGTFALVFFGCGAIMSGENAPMVFGLVVATMIYSVGHISGAHFNPAVTFAFTVARHFPKRELPFYWLGQFLGGLAAMVLLKFLIPEANTFGATVPSIDLFPAFVWEVVLSFTLMFVITAVATDTRAEGTMAGLAIGLAVLICATVGGPYSGASMNPARSFGPALLQAEMSSFWIYFFGPLLGASLAALTYEKIRCADNSKSAEGCC